MQWISVKDRLPEEYTPVLVAYKFSREVQALINGMWHLGFDPSGRDVTHWMYIPELPIEGV